MNPRQRPVIAQVVEILADGLRRDLETPGQILHHHPAKGAGDIENLGLAVGQAGHGAPRTKRALWCGGSSASSTRQIGFRGRRPWKGEFWLRRSAPESAAGYP